MKTPRAITIKPGQDVRLTRKDADGTLTFEIVGNGCLTHPFQIGTWDSLDDSGYASGNLCHKEVMIGSKGGLTLT